MTLKIFGNSGDWAGTFEDDGAHGGFTLAPCPFCGGCDLELINTHSPSYWIECKGCGGEAHGGSPRGHGGGLIRTKVKCETLHRQAQRLAVGRWNSRFPQNGSERS